MRVTDGCGSGTKYAGLLLLPLMAHERGYRSCGQPFAHADVLDAQLLEDLGSLKLPDDVRERIEHAVAGHIENNASLKRMAELKEIVERIDLKCENGFMDKDEYLSKRTELQREIEALRPIDYDDLTKAADMLQNFRSCWDACAETETPAEARKEPAPSVVNRVYVNNWVLVAIVLHSDYAVVLGENETAHANIASAVQKLLVERGSNGDSACNWSGDDGRCPRHVGVNHAQDLANLPLEQLSPRTWGGTSAWR